MPGADYMTIVGHYERCLAEHGSGARAVDWKSPESAAIRYDVMLGLLGADTNKVSLLDFGCGLGDLKRHIAARGLEHIAYEGLDISPEYASAARLAHPDTPIHCLDVLQSEAVLPQFDYVVMNGIFTRREEIGPPAMLDYLERLTTRLFSQAQKGLAFNVMSTCVDWRSENLFHPGFDDLASVISRALSRNFVMRNDYGLYECTVYVYREPRV
jgi:SAM-dependent methyltransferase